MPTIVNIREAKTHLSRLLERVKAGEEIIIANAGKPHARLVPLAQGERELGFLEGTVPPTFHDPLPDEELEAGQ